MNGDAGVDVRPSSRDLFHTIEHAIDELHGFGARELAGDFDGFVDHYCVRGCGIAEKLGNRGAQDVAIDGGHAFHAPVLGVSFNQLIDIGSAVGGDAEQIVSEAFDFIDHFILLSPEGAANLIGALLSHVSLKEHLQDQFAGFAASAQKSALSFQPSALG